MDTTIADQPWSDSPPITSLLDTDFYKLLMCQCIWRNQPDVQVTFRVINRDASVRLADALDLGALREGLDHMRTLSITSTELEWLQRGDAWGDPALFGPDFLNWLGSVQLPPYHLETKNGQLALTFSGPWPSVMLWEVPAMALIMELRGRYQIRQIGRSRVRALYARAATRLREKVFRLRHMDGVRVADFGTRRRHGAAWQAWCFSVLSEALGSGCLGTSNVALARECGSAVVGTIGHELPQVYAAVATDDAALIQAPFEAFADWQVLYAERWRLVLPDTFGTRPFLERAPSWLARWSGLRLDSGDPIRGAEDAINWWRRHGEDPAVKRLIFSDGMDVDKMAQLHHRFSGRVQVVFGWGTLLTNDFAGLAPDDGLAPVSLVCKAVAAGGNPVVKLSDAPGKALGDPMALARYRQLFSVDGDAGGDGSA